MQDRIRFVRSGRVEEVRPTTPTQTVLEWLREEKRLKGTKEGCAEGDCGACTVVVGEPDGETLRYRAVNSCIQFLPMLDGKLLVTVEDLADPDAVLHPVQRAMVEMHGSQCGFCTPGFIMSLFALFHERPEKAASRGDIDLGLAGNLCRCTGYAPIVRAAQQALTGGRSDSFDTWEASNLGLLKSIDRAEPLALETPNGSFHAPLNLDDLFHTLELYPQALLVAGATDAGLWVTKQLRRFPVLVYTGRVAELREIERDDQHGILSIGAAVTYTDALPMLVDAHPGFREVIERLGGRQVRNAGTIGGNIANGSPIGDMPPGLIALGSKLVLCSRAGRRTMPLEDFFQAYGRQDLRAGEIVEKILLPLPAAERSFATYKVSKRFEQDISAVCAGFCVDLDGNRVRSARIAFGGMAATPKRAPACEAALSGAPWSEQTVREAQAALEADFTPISDLRASAAYRMRVARNLLTRFYLESTGSSVPARLGSKYGAADA